MPLILTSMEARLRTISQVIHVAASNCQRASRHHRWMAEVEELYHGTYHSYFIYDAKVIVMDSTMPLVYSRRIVSSI